MTNKDIEFVYNTLSNKIIPVEYWWERDLRHGVVPNTVQKIYRPIQKLSRKQRKQAFIIDELDKHTDL